MHPENPRLKINFFGLSIVLLHPEEDKCDQLSIHIKDSTKTFYSEMESWEEN